MEYLVPESPREAVGGDERSAVRWDKLRSGFGDSAIVTAAPLISPELKYAFSSQWESRTCEVDIYRTWQLSRSQEVVLKYPWQLLFLADRIVRQVIYSYDKR